MNEEEKNQLNLNGKYQLQCETQLLLNIKRYFFHNRLLLFKMGLKINWKISDKEIHGVLSPYERLHSTCKATYMIPMYEGLPIFLAEGNHIWKFIAFFLHWYNDWLLKFLFHHPRKWKIFCLRQNVGCRV